MVRVAPFLTHSLYLANFSRFHNVDCFNCEQMLHVTIVIINIDHVVVSIAFSHGIGEYKPYRVREFKC